MEIKLKEITVKELTTGYIDNDELGVLGYDERLDIRPPYQREFIYKDKQRDAVIDTVIKGFPLNVMYWAVKDNGNFEVIDGQQRTISISQYIDGDFSFNDKYFHNLQKDEQEQILNYKLMVYLCSGDDSEKLEWFKTINISGEKLTNQELRNAVYSGSWVTDAKKYFSKNDCPVYNIGYKYLKGVANRQEYLETFIKWISDDSIEDYMGKNQHQPNANGLWLYFNSVMNWTKATFPNYRKEMKGVEWGYLYNQFKDELYDSTKIEDEVSTLMEDEDVTRKQGIYQFILTRNEKYLSIRVFSKNQIREAYERQNGLCPKCETENNHYDIGAMEADHITPWSKGGKTNSDNCQMLCKKHNRLKSNI